MTEPDHGLKARLDNLRAKATDDDLADEGNHFCAGMGYTDLTQCNHGDCEYFCNRGDGPLIAALWNALRANQLITLSDHEAAVKAAMDAAFKSAIAAVRARKAEYVARGKNAHDVERAMLMDDIVMAHDYAIDAIRARANGGE